MTAVHETASGIQFLIGMLSSDSTLMSLSPGGVCRAFALVQAPLPVTIVAFQSGIDTLTANGRRLLVRALYQVKASGPMINASDVFALASQIDVVLGGNQGLRNIAVTGSFILSVFRESSIQYDEDASGIQYTHLGGLYRVISQQM
jgi:hypothetical protein